MSLGISINKIEKILTTTSYFIRAPRIERWIKKTFSDSDSLFFKSTDSIHLMHNLTQRLPMHTKYNFDAINVILRSLDHVFCC